MRRWL
jgi:glutathione S-transferase